MTTWRLCHSCVVERVSHNNLPYIIRWPPNRPLVWTPGTLSCRDRPSYPALHLRWVTKKVVFQDPSRKDPERRTTFTLSQTRYEKLQLLVTKQKCSRLAAGNHNHPFAAKPDTDELNSKGSIQIVETRVPSIQNPGKNDCPILLKWVERLKRYCCLHLQKNLLEWAASQKRTTKLDMPNNSFIFCFFKRQCYPFKKLFATGSVHMEAEELPPHWHLRKWPNDKHPSSVQPWCRNIHSAKSSWNEGKEMRCQMWWWISQSCEFLINLISWICISLSVCEHDWGCSHANTTKERLRKYQVQASFCLSPHLYGWICQSSQTHPIFWKAQSNATSLPTRNPRDLRRAGSKNETHSNKMIAWFAANEQLNFILCSYYFPYQAFSQV